MEIEKKVWPEFFNKIMAGEKNFEIRLADFDCQPGDFLILKEWDPQTKEYTGREAKKEISCVIKTRDLVFWPKEEIEKYGYQAIGFK